METFFLTGSLGIGARRRHRFSTVRWESVLDNLLRAAEGSWICFAFGSTPISREMAPNTDSASLTPCSPIDIYVAFHRPHTATPLALSWALVKKAEPTRVLLAVNSICIFYVLSGGAPQPGAGMFGIISYRSAPKESRDR